MHFEAVIIETDVFRFPNSIFYEKKKDNDLRRNKDND